MSCFLPIKHLQQRWLADPSSNLAIKDANISHVMEDCNKIIPSSKLPQFYILGTIFKGNSAVAKGRFAPTPFQPVKLNFT